MSRFLIYLLVLLFSSSTVAVAQVESEAVCTVPAGKSSNLAIDNKSICVDDDPNDAIEGNTVRLVGYGIVPVTIDDRWRDDDCNSNCDPEANTCSSSLIKRVLATFQVDMSQPRTGANTTRTFAIGGSCNVAFSAANRICKGFSNRPELMPFERLADGRFNVKFIDNSDLEVDGNLNRCWEARFRFFLKEAERNGLVVIVSLFDENTMTGTGSNSTWHRNPWNPANNNMGKLLPTLGSGLPDFYHICPNMEGLQGASGRCSNSSLNALGKIQKKYVTKVVEAVKKSGVRNVMFEVMNQGRLGDNDAHGSHLDSIVLAAWHNTVASWFTDYLWVASVKKGQYKEMRRLLRECRSNANCKDSNPTGTEGNGNPLLVFWRSGIDIIKPHFNIWSGTDLTGDFCLVSDDLFRFGKPVMIDNDGGPRESVHDNRLLAQWTTDLCGRSHGSIHFYHTKDGTRLKGKVAPVCEEADTTYVDCNALDSLANDAGNQYVGPTDLCGKIVKGLDCPPKFQYCNACYE